MAWRGRKAAGRRTGVAAGVRRVPPPALWKALGAMLLLALWQGDARAIQTMEDEENIAELLPAPFPSEEAAREDATRSRLWAILPQFGYQPDTGFLGGVQASHGNLFGAGVKGSLNGYYARNRQQAYSISVGSPHLARERLLVLFRARYRLEPTRRFFGLGSNDVGPDPLTVHAFEEAAGAVTVGWRPWRRVALNFGVGLRYVDIRCSPGDTEDPCTPVAFPNLPGIEGGLVNYLAFSVVWNTRDSVVRPTRGWRLIAKVIHSNRVFLSDYTFTRFVGDAGYLHAFLHERLVLGLRVNGEWISGPSRNIPFWELSELGGKDTLRGFFPHRFLGKGRFLVNAEVRFLIFEFDFFRIWDVRIDGVLFGDGGRVFLNEEDLQDEFILDERFLTRVFEGFKYSLGAGIRFALSRSTVARVDVGFSEEETALVYLAFGHTF